MVAHNPYWNFIKSNTHVNWDWDAVTRNPNITSEIIADNLNYPWDFEYVSKHLMHSITPKMIIEHPDKNWCFDRLSSWSGITIELVLAFKDRHWRPLILYLNKAINILNIMELSYLFPYYIPSISTRPDLTIDIIKDNPQFEWCWNPISCHKNITIDIVLQNPDIPWNYNTMSANSNMTWNIIKANPQIPWNIHIVSANDNITIDIVMDNIDLAWDFELLSANETLTWTDVKNTINILPWELDVLVYRKQIDWVVIEELIEEDWDFYILSEPIDLPWDLVRNYPSKHWDFYQLSKRKDIAWDLVMAYPDKLWNYQLLSENTSVTKEVINSTLHKQWNMKELCKLQHICKCIISGEINTNINRFMAIGSYYEFNIIKNILDYYMLNEDNRNILINSALENPLITPKIINKNISYFVNNLSEFSYNPLCAAKYFKSYEFRKNETKKRLEVMYHELIARSCSTNRLFEWNEDAKFIFPDTYNDYCKNK